MTRTLKIQQAEAKRREYEHNLAARVDKLYEAYKREASADHTCNYTMRILKLENLMISDPQVKNSLQMRSLRRFVESPGTVRHSWHSIRARHKRQMTARSR